MPKLADYELTFQLSAGSVDTTARIIRGATVAQAGVEALGKFVYVDRDGQLMREAGEGRRKMPVFTDEGTLDTLMTAAAAAGGTLKIRSDHDDSLRARAGHADNFVRIAPKDGLAGRVVADLHFNESYRDLDIVMEVSKKTPELIGLSIDMLPSFELLADRVLMRIEELLAVDVVDAGAITHGGMFLRSGVDNAAKDITGQLLAHKNSSPSTMAEDPKKEPTIAECMAVSMANATAITALTAAIQKMSEATKPVVPAADETLKSGLSDVSTKLSALTDTVTTMKKTQAALGLKVGIPSGDPTADAAAESERQRLSVEQAKGNKTYLQLVADKSDTLKLKKSDAHTAVQRENPAAYEKHLVSKGIIRAA